MRRFVILTTLTLLLLAVAGVTAAQDGVFGPPEPGDETTTPVERTVEGTISEPPSLERTAGEDEDGAEVGEDRERPPGDTPGPDASPDSGTASPDASEPDAPGAPSDGTRGSRADRPEGPGGPEWARDGEHEEAGQGGPGGRGHGGEGEPDRERGGDEEREREPGGAQKVTLCHEGHTLSVGAPARDAHLRHGDAAGAC